VKHVFASRFHRHHIAALFAKEKHKIKRQTFKANVQNKDVTNDVKNKGKRNKDVKKDMKNKYVKNKDAKQRCEKQRYEIQRNEKQKM
jgi:hypothetical protein